MKFWTKMATKNKERHLNLSYNAADTRVMSKIADA
jgi:hypothetical protein